MNARHLLLLPTAALLPLAACSGGSRAPEAAWPRAASPSAPPPSRSATCPRTWSSRARSSRAPRCRSWPRSRRAWCACCGTRARASRRARCSPCSTTPTTGSRNDRARAALAVAEANRAHAQTEKERADNLLKTGGITDKDHLSAQVALQVAEASLAQARAEAAIAEQQLTRTQIKAPFRGRVAKRIADPGAMLAPGTPLFTIVDDSVLEFRRPSRRATSARSRSARPSSSRSTRSPARAVEGRIARIEPLVDERSRSFQAVVEVPGRAELVGGLFARAFVRVGQVAGAIVVPPAALVRDGSDPTKAEVFVVRGGKAEKVARDARRRGARRRPGHERPRGRRPGRPRPADRARLGRAGRGAQRAGGASAAAPPKRAGGE